MKEREHLLKSREYATAQREQARKNALDKKDKVKRVQEKGSQPQPDAFVRTHAVVGFRSNADLQMPIEERDTDSEYSHKPRETEEQAATRREYERRDQFISMYKRIDQTTLSQIGIKSKASLEEGAIEEVHGFSMLQRFRQDRDLNSFDRTKPILDQSDDSEESEEDLCENINIRNFDPAGAKPQTALNQAREQKKSVKAKIANKEEKAPEFKWWVGGDPNAAERQLMAKKE